MSAAGIPSCQTASDEGSSCQAESWLSLCHVASEGPSLGHAWVFAKAWEGSGIAEGFAVGPLGNGAASRPAGDIRGANIGGRSRDTKLGDVALNISGGLPCFAAGGAYGDMLGDNTSPGLASGGPGAALGRAGAESTIGGRASCAGLTWTPVGQACCVDVGGPET